MLKREKRGIVVQCLKSACKKIIEWFKTACNRVCVSLELAVSLTLFAGGLVLILDPGLLKQIIGVLAGKWLPAFGAVLCFISGYIFCQAIILLTKGKTRESVNEVMERHRKMEEYEQKVKEAQSEIAEKEKELKEIKSSGNNSVNYESFEPMLGLILNKATLNTHEWVHERVVCPQNDCSNFRRINEFCEKAKKTFLKSCAEFKLGYLEKEVSANFGVDLQKVRFLRSDGVIRVYGVESRPFGCESRKKAEMFVKYKAYFKRTEKGQNELSQQDEATRNIDEYKRTNCIRFEDDGFIYDRDDSEKGDIQFGDMGDFPSVCEEKLDQMIRNAEGEGFEIAHETTVRLFKGILEFLLKPMGCQIRIEEGSGDMEHAVPLKQLCEEYNHEQAKLQESVRNMDAVKLKS